MCAWRGQTNARWEITNLDPHRGGIPGTLHESGAPFFAVLHGWPILATPSEAGTFPFNTPNTTAGLYGEAAAQVELPRDPLVLLWDAATPF